MGEWDASWGFPKKPGDNPGDWKILLDLGFRRREGTHKPATTAQRKRRQPNGMRWQHRNPGRTCRRGNCVRPLEQEKRTDRMFRCAIRPEGNTSPDVGPEGLPSFGVTLGSDRKGASRLRTTPSGVGWIRCGDGRQDAPRGVGHDGTAPGRAQHLRVAGTCVGDANTQYGGLSRPPER